MSYSIVLEKSSLRRLDEDTMRRNLRKIVGRSLAGDRTKWGWTCDKFNLPEPDSKDGEYRYSVKLNFRKRKPGGEDLDDAQFARLVEMASSACSGNGRWSLSGVGDQQVPAKACIEVGKINTDLGQHFSHIYDREAQIQIVHSALMAFEFSERKNKFHSVLWGMPASAKTEILLAVERMVGPEAVFKLDATSTTKAGAEKILLESEVVPPILLIEEIEKTDENSLRWLLGLLDFRAEIRKTNYRIGTQFRKVDMFCLATANDMHLFNNLMSGALASRFSNKIYCPRPTPEIMRRILVREVDKVKGNPAWIPPTLDYCARNEINDPRNAITICLCGQDKLLDGRYQDYLDATSAPKN
jgi:hypothetical protein